MSAGAADAAADRSITNLLTEFTRGNRVAERELADLVYGELKRLAAIYMSRERGGHTLQPTALVSEAWARLGQGAEVEWQNRAHFFAVAANCMRQVLIDYARKRRTAKRGGGVEAVALEDNLNCLNSGGQSDPVDILALNELLERLRELDLRAFRVIEMRYFGGLSYDEIGEVLNISSRTALRDWEMARQWLNSELSKTP